MKKRFIAIALAFAITVASIGNPLTSYAITSTQSMAVPAYEYPTLTNLWPQIDAAGGAGVPFVIVNPASGPGTSAVSDYTNRIAANNTAGIRSIGYVDTNYQTRPMTDVITDINNWYTLYPGIKGILFDRVSVVGSPALCYSAYVHNYAKLKNTTHLTIQNFGTYTSPAYEPYGDIFLNAEMDHTLYQTWVTPTDGFQNNSAYSNRFWHIVHTTNSTDLNTTLTQTRNNNAGWVYITDDTMPNPYDAAASYWNTELSAIGSLPATPIPNRGVTQLPAGCLDMTVNNQSTINGASVTHTKTLTNSSSLYTAFSPTTVAFALPNGVTASNLGGTGWVCAQNSCTYNANIAPNASASPLSATFTADCSYTSGNVTGTVTSFPQQTTTSTISIPSATGCATGSNNATLAETGTNLYAILAVGASLIAGGGVITYRRLQQNK